MFVLMWKNWITIVISADVIRWCEFFFSFLLTVCVMRCAFTESSFVCPLQSTFGGAGASEPRSKLQADLEAVLPAIRGLPEGDLEIVSRASLKFTVNYASRSSKGDVAVGSAANRSTNRPGL
jgi:hypothetical protein